MKQQRDTKTAGELIQRQPVQEIFARRFNIDKPICELKHRLADLYAYECQLRRRKFVPDPDTARHITAAAEWLSSSRGKDGLILLGLYGNGKTTLLKAICRTLNQHYYHPIPRKRKSIRFISAKDIAKIGSNEGMNAEFEELCTCDFLAIDDLGEEPAEIMRYGMIHTPVKDLIMRRYELRLPIMATTNLCNSTANPQLQRYYGPRVADRMKEQMKFIVFSNESYR